MDTMSCIEFAEIKGKAEERASIARTMKGDGVPVQAISKYTGLTVAEIEAL